MYKNEEFKNTEERKLKLKLCIKDATGVFKKYPQTFIIPVITYILGSYILAVLRPKQNISYSVLEWAFLWFLSFATIRLIYDSIETKPIIRNSIEAALRKHILILFAALLSLALDEIVLGELVYNRGLIFLILPAIYVGVRLSFAPYSAIIDNYTLLNALKGSWSMTKGIWWKIAALQLALWIPLPIVILVYMFIAENIEPPLILSYVFFPLLTILFVTQLAALTVAYLQVSNGEITRRENEKQTRND